MPALGCGRALFPVEIVSTTARVCLSRRLGENVRQRSIYCFLGCSRRRELWWSKSPVVGVSCHFPASIPGFIFGLHFLSGAQAYVFTVSLSVYLGLAVSTSRRRFFRPSSVARLHGVGGNPSGGLHRRRDEKQGDVYVGASGSGTLFAPARQRQIGFWQTEGSFGDRWSGSAMAIAAFGCGLPSAHRFLGLRRNGRNPGAAGAFVRHVLGLVFVELFGALHAALIA